MTDDPHDCDLHYQGIRQNHGKPFELYVCIICGREEWRPYSGAIDTVEGRP